MQSDKRAHCSVAMAGEMGESAAPHRVPVRRKRSAACGSLIAGVLEHLYIPSDGDPACASVGGRPVPLPAYIPYVGVDYFRHRPRVLCYAINQNLSRHRRWTEDWATQWGQDMHVAVDRLNRAAEDGRAIPIKPYAEGFIPLVAAMALAADTAPGDGRGVPLIDDIIAVTNFVKFSTATDASSSSIPASWWRECAKRYVGDEIEVLQPDVVIAFGQRTVRELKRVLASADGPSRRPRLLACPFPGRIPSVKARPLSPEEGEVWRCHILPLVDRIRRPPADSYHEWRMTRFPGYFCDIARSWRVFF